MSDGTLHRGIKKVKCDAEDQAERTKGDEGPGCFNLGGKEEDAQVGKTTYEAGDCANVGTAVLTYSRAEESGDERRYFCRDEDGLTEEVQCYSHVFGEVG